NVAIDLEPVHWHVAAVDVTERVAGPAGRLIAVEQEERVVGPARRRLRRGGWLWVAVRPLQPGGRIDVISVVELRRRPQRAEQQPADVRALLNEGAARIGVSHVPANREVVAQPVRALQTHGRALIDVVRPDHVPPVCNALTTQTDHVTTRLSAERAMSVVA